MTTGEDVAGRFAADHRHLRGVAFRILGSLDDAEDAVQQTWIKASRADLREVQNLTGWLTTVTAVATQAVEEEVVLAESVGRALLVVLQRLTPAERVTFVLHGIFAVGVLRDRRCRRAVTGSSEKAGRSGPRRRSAAWTPCRRKRWSWAGALRQPSWRSSTAVPASLETSYCGWRVPARSCCDPGPATPPPNSRHCSGRWCTAGGGNDFRGSIRRTDGAVDPVAVPLGESASDARMGAAAEAAAARPGLVLAGSEDPFTGGSELARHGAARMKARFEQLDGLDHWWMLQDPARAAELLEDF